MMKQRFFAILSILVVLSMTVVAFTSLSSCGKSNEVVLNVYNWGEYISDGEDETVNVVEAFETYFNENLAAKYGHTIKVN